MRKIFWLILGVLIFAISATQGTAKDNLQSFSSDSTGVKLEYPKEWKVEEYKWGFTVTDPQTQSTVTLKSQFFPKEYEEAYDIDFNEEFEKVYVGKFEEVLSEERQLDGLTWDYSMITGAKGSALEYNQETYSTLINNSLYSIEVFYNTSIAQELKEPLHKVAESVKIMYKETELPMVKRYMKEYNNAAAKSSKLTFDSPDRGVNLEYAPPWAFSGAGSGSEGGFHYFTGDPYLDIDMIIVKHESKDPREAIISLKTWVGLLTDTFILAEENTTTYGKHKYHYQKLVQGTDEHIVHTWLYAIEQGEGTTVFVFAFHQRTADKASQIIDGIMNDVKIRPL